MDELGGRVHAEVAYARPDVQEVLPVCLARGALVRDAVEASGILTRFPEIDLESQPVGIFGEIVGLDDPVREHDRIEIYRALRADPKDMRRKRARRRG